MDLHKIIESLNNKNYSTKPDEVHLSDEEKSVIEKYQPQNVFIVYGSLGPGRPNHYRIEHINGRWSKATINGKLEAKGWGANLGYFGFVKTDPEEEQQEIEAFVLFSDELERNWQYLDDFEGYEYERVIAEYKLHNGDTGVGNIYALKIGG